MKKNYTLIGVDGNALSIMGYVKQALEETGHGNLIKEYVGEATSGDYTNLLGISEDYIDIVNGE